MTSAEFEQTTPRGFTKEQLYSTASYEAKDLRGIFIHGNDLSGWDFTEQDLAGANFGATNLGVTPADLTSASFAGANLTDAKFSLSPFTSVDLTGAIVAGADLGVGVFPAPGSTFTREQLYSTASYQDKNLRGIVLNGDLTGWDLSGQDLTGASLLYCSLTGTDLSGANLKNAHLFHVESLESGILDSATTHNQWTYFPRNFDPADAGLTLVPSRAGDFDANDLLGAADVNALAVRIRDVDGRRSWPNRSMFDLNTDVTVDDEDHRIWVTGLKTWYGDANLNGEFDSGDMVQVFTLGRYEEEPTWTRWREALDPVSWSEGDWNGDGIFDSSDMVKAFEDGGYEKGPRTDAVVVPEPMSFQLLMGGLIGIATFRRHLRLRGATA